MNRKDIFIKVNEEREKQIRKWGANRKHDIFFWLSILGEEVGECHRSALQIEQEKTKTTEDLKKELIQSMSVCSAILEEYFYEEEK